MSEDFQTLLGEFEQQRKGSARLAPRPGDRVRGRILSIGPEWALVDLGLKSEGQISVADLANGEEQPPLGEGDALDAVVLSRDALTGAVTLSRGAGRKIRNDAGLQQAYETQMPVEGLVTGVTKGGLEVQVAGTRAFCPASQVDSRFIEDLQPYIGQRLVFRITRYQGGHRPNVVLSRRVMLEEEQRNRAAEVRAQLEVGAILKGTITSIKDFGAFVDLGGVEGMIHVSELAHGRVTKPQDVLTVGQGVEVAVMRIDKTDNPRQPERIALSIRALAADPWQEAESRYPLGSQVQGKVTRLQPFGAFVELEAGIEGLIHIGELASGRRITHPREVVNPGDSVEALVLAVDVSKRRISLTLDLNRQVEPTVDVAAYRNTPSRPAPAGKGSKGGKTDTRTAGSGESDSIGTFGQLLRDSLTKATKG